MPAVIPNAAEVLIANYAVNKATPQDLTLFLWTNNITPAETDTTATYTEASGSGYAAISIPSSDWTVTSGDPTTAVCVEKTFTLTGALTVYGYGLKRTTAGTIAMAERFSDGPYVIPAGGGTIKVTPTMTFA